MKRCMIFLISIGCALSLAVAGEVQLLKATLVTVNGVRITQDHVNQMAEVMLRRRHGDIEKLRLTQEEEQAVFDASLRELIRMELILHDGKAFGLEVPDARVQGNLKRLKLDGEDMPEVARKFGESDAMVDHLLVKRGFSPYRPSPKEIRDIWLKERDSTFKTNCFVKVRHILLPTYGNNNLEGVEKKAQLFRQRIIKKESAERSNFFAMMAREFSDGRFAEHGGLLRIGRDPTGWFPQDFGNVRADGKPVFPVRLYRGVQAFTQKDRNQVSKVIRSENGFHLLLLEDIRGGKQIPWSEAQQLIRAHLEQRERNRRTLVWLKDKLRSSQVLWNDGQAVEVERILPSEKLKEYQLQ